MIISTNEGAMGSYFTSH